MCQATLKSATSPTRQPRIGQYVYAEKGTISQMVRGEEIEMITSGACAHRTSEPPESTATKSAGLAPISPLHTSPQA